MDKTVVELFAGVGGFRVGLNNIKEIDVNGRAVEKGNFDFVWSNQWEPATKIQPAFDCYNLRFCDSANSNEDIHLVDKQLIPNHSLLCGGFPCQDYSVARSKSNEKGIEGKKGVLWWDINEILKIKKPPFVLLENVDRLIKSPANQRGRDFSVMLYCFYQLGYFVEWRVVNAADYGFPQRRRRVYVFAFLNSTKYAQKIKKQIGDNDTDSILLRKGLFARQFKVDNLQKQKSMSLSRTYVDILDVSNRCAFYYENAGIMVEGNVYTGKVSSVKESPYNLARIVDTDEINERYFLSEEKIEKMRYLRGKKRILRTKPNGETYYYSEGALSKYDSLDLPSRTMLTSEGTTNRSTHVIKGKNGRFRILTPVECERLNQFPDNWTNSGMSERQRYFMMGNALVCGVISRIGKYLEKIIEGEK